MCSDQDRHSTTSSNPRLREFGPWTEQYSSTGKRYFYNRETEVSQWEKPPEWREYEKSLTENAPNHSPISSSCEDGRVISDGPGISDARYSSAVMLLLETGARGAAAAATYSYTQPYSNAATSTSNSFAYEEAKGNNRKQRTNRDMTQTQTPRAKRPKLETTEEDAIGPVVFNEEQHRRFFRPDLVSYIRRWPSEECEQSAWKADAAAHNLTLQISNVSCDVKCARALVKTAEMRSSLLAQKLLFLADHQRQLEASFTLPSLPSMSTF
uniref:WW domain-containing protein n=1 Tax=Ascaris lumbricoides TaxID=6252 RepID=A0A0M3I772_ASCLU